MEKGINDKLAQEILDAKDAYIEASKTTRQKWTDFYKHYMGNIDSTKNPYLANIFIPKTHEAVELMTAYLVGPNQSISVSPEGPEDNEKATIVRQWLDFVWRKTVKARDSVVAFIKQAILFGNGIIKIGYEVKNGSVVPFLEVVNLPDVYFDYYKRNIQESTWVIFRIIKSKEVIGKDERYDKKWRKQVISENVQQDEENSNFSSEDKTVTTESPDKPVEFYEAYSLDRVVTIAPTSMGWQVLRDIENEFAYQDGEKFIPCVKVRFKTNPLPNRAYDIGMVEPTEKLQLALNDMFNEVFDNVSLINNKMVITRRGAKINPQDLVSRPGGKISCDNIETDIKWLEVGDIKASAMDIIQMLDNEFQQASGVVNLLKGISESDTATEAQIGQRNAQTLLDMVDENIKDAMSEVGQMLLCVMLKHIDEIQSIKVIDNSDKMVFVTIDPSNLNGKYDIRVSADRSNSDSKAVKRKQLIDFINILKSDPVTVQKYPDALEKAYKEWLKEYGVGDVEYFFQQSAQMGMPQMMGQPQTTGGLPATDQGMTPEAIQQGASMSPEQGIPQY